MHEGTSRATSFGVDAEQYDRARPSYPEELVQEIVEAARTGSARSGGTFDEAVDVLDVGCGTGIAARLIAAKGCRVLGVEADERMAAVARGWGVSVETARFEEWDENGREFDLLSCGQAWHWIDPVAGSAKAAAVLRRGGSAALFWNEGSYSPEVKGALDRVYREIAPGLDDDSILLGLSIEQRLGAVCAALRGTGSFEEPAVKPYPWRRSYSRAEWLDHLPTHSDHRALPSDLLAALLEAVGGVLDEFGGHLEVEYTAWLVLARQDAHKGSAGELGLPLPPP